MDPGRKWNQWQVLDGDLLIFLFCLWQRRGYREIFFSFKKNKSNSTEYLTTDGPCTSVGVGCLSIQCWMFILEEALCWAIIKLSNKEEADLTLTELPAGIRHCTRSCVHMVSLVLMATRCRSYHLHVWKRDLRPMEVRPRVQGSQLPRAAEACVWGPDGAWVWMSCCSQQENNSGDLKHERNWIKVIIDHRIHRKPKELEWGKIGTRENSRDPGGKTNGQIHQEILALVPCSSLVRKGGTLIDSLQ